VSVPSIISRNWCKALVSNWTYRDDCFVQVCGSCTVTWMLTCPWGWRWYSRCLTVRPPIYFLRLPLATRNATERSPICILLVVRLFVCLVVWACLIWYICWKLCTLLKVFNRFYINPLLLNKACV
jgi:hypothetical protein